MNEIEQIEKVEEEKTRDRLEIERDTLALENQTLQEKVSELQQTTTQLNNQLRQAERFELMARRESSELRVHLKNALDKLERCGVDS